MANVVHDGRGECCCATCERASEERYQQQKRERDDLIASAARKETILRVLEICESWKHEGYGAPMVQDENGDDVFASKVDQAAAEAIERVVAAIMSDVRALGAKAGAK